MKFSLKHILFFVFLISIALSSRSLAIAWENDGITGIGVLVACFTAAIGLTILKTNRWLAWIAGVTTTFVMCTIDTIERANMNPEMGYLWRHRIQAHYSTAPELGMIVTAAFTFFATIVSGIGVGAGTLCNKSIRRNAG